jgi:hypothetical protein
MYAQIRISANLRQHGKFNYKTNMYDNAFKDNNEFTSFEFDRDFTILTHTVNSKTSIYLIKSQKHDEVNDRWEFDIISDTGYSYYLIIDIQNKNIRFIYRLKGFAYLTQYDITRVLVDKPDVP